MDLLVDIALSNAVWKKRKKKISKDDFKLLDISLKGLNTLRIEGMIVDEKGQTECVEGIATINPRTFSKVKNEMLYKTNYCFYMRRDENGNFREDLY